MCLETHTIGLLVEYQSFVVCEMCEQKPHCCMKCMRKQDGLTDEIEHRTNA